MPSQTTTKNAAQTLVHPGDIIQEAVFVEYPLGNINEMGGLFLGTLAESGCCRQPAGVAPHRLQDGNIVEGAHGFQIKAGIPGGQGEESR